MENDAATLYCPNELCQAANPLTHKFCQRCSTPLPKRYLWAVAEQTAVGNSGELLQERYLIIEQNVLLDTKPGILQQIPEQQKLDDIKSYLRLIPYRLHIPQVYGLLSLNTGNTPTELLLLEKPPLILHESPPQVQLCEQLTDVWKKANSWRQLNWLWQISQLWQPLATVGVASSLLTKNLIRTEGWIVRLLELSSDGDTRPKLAALGEFWQEELFKDARSTIRNFMGEVCRLLVEGEIHSSEQLTALLDRGLTSLSKSNKIAINVFALTDTGPSRQRNEDSCYPQSGTTISKPPEKSALTIVCDGIGGHEGGDVASRTAIETIQHQVAKLASLPEDRIDPHALLADLEQAAAIANDKISQLNDSENRQGRQRMGTTVVMALPVAHEMYITHVGDSRAYLITRNNCHQVTLDDDVASREVRLGYAVYRDAVSQAASGSLVQALGMNASSALHPTAQRFILDEDCVFLLCSDGLSDFDRVEQYWETEILPLINHNSDVVSVTKQLLEIANNQNGHDNVTIATVHCQAKYSEPKLALEANLADVSSISVADSSHLAPVIQNIPNQKTQVIPEKATRKGMKLPLTLGAIALLTIVGGSIGYLWRQGLFMFSDNPQSEEIGQSEIKASSSPKQTFEANQRLAQIDKGWLINAKAKLNLSKSTSPPAEKVPTQALPIFAPPASLLQVVQKQQISSSRDYWLQIKVCSVGDAQGVINSSNSSAPTATTGSRTLLKPGEQVWLKRSQLTPSNVSIAEPAAATEICSTPDSSAPAIEDSSISVPVEDSLTPGQPSIQPKPGDIPGGTPLPTPNG